MAVHQRKTTQLQHFTLGIRGWRRQTQFGTASLGLTPRRLQRLYEAEIRARETRKVDHDLLVRLNFAQKDGFGMIGIGEKLLAFKYN